MKTLKKMLAGSMLAAVLLIGATPAHAEVKAVVAGYKDVFGPQLQVFVDYMEDGVSIDDADTDIFYDENSTIEDFEQLTREAVLADAAIRTYSITEDDISFSHFTTADANRLIGVATSSLVANLPAFYHNSSLYTGSKVLTYSTTTTSGQSVVHLTTNGLSGGTAICSGTPKHVNITANDPSNTFGLGYALSNSDKTLTITANVRTFSGVTILGIPVLGSQSLSAAPNGTPLGISVVCN